MKPTDSYQTQLAEAAAWRLAALLLERPRPGWHQEVAQLAGEVRDPALRKAAAAASGATEGDYLALIGPGGAVPPRGVTYQSFADPGHLLAQLASLYEIFAFHPHVEEPIDHVAVEVAFVSYLLLKEAFATARGDIEAAAATLTARNEIIDNHLATIAAPFAQRVEAAGATSHILDAAQWLAARVPAAPQLPIPIEEMDMTDMCGACSTTDGLL